LIIKKGFNMSELVTCLSCHGRKQLTGLGTILVDCTTCKGIGYISFVNKTDIPLKPIVAPASDPIVLPDDSKDYQNLIAKKLNSEGKRVKIQKGKK
jgi:hypothetical protein